jgi:hypothetical protein
MARSKDSVKYGTVGYIVGYDGQLVGGDVPKGKWVLPVGGMTAKAKVFNTEDNANAALGGRTTYVEATLAGKKTYVLKVHKVKASFFPFFADKTGYKKLVDTKALVNA